MAGDWIKMRMDLMDDPAVISVAAACGLDEFQVIGRLHKLWSWADRHTSDGVTAGVDPKWVDRYVICQGFADALISSEWLRFSDGVLSFPGFSIHNGASAKSRCDAALRQRISRGRHEGVTNGGSGRSPIPRPFIRAVMKRDNYTCVYCGTESSPEREITRKSLLSIDHILPVSRTNGRQAIEDLVTCCKLCNAEKNDRTPEEWGVPLKFLQPGLEYQDFRIVVTESCDKPVTREEKRREEKNKEDESEVPSRDDAITQATNAGVPDDFAAMVFSRWTEQGGRNANGLSVSWLPHVKGRWERERVEWEAGTHRGKRKESTAPQRQKSAWDINARISAIKCEIARLEERRDEAPKHWRKFLKAHYPDNTSEYSPTSPVHGDFVRWMRTQSFSPHSPETLAKIVDLKTELEKLRQQLATA